jgi:hypothetical protein
MSSVIYYIKETVYGWLFVCAIRGKWSYTSVSAHSITCRNRKEYGRNQGKVFRTKAYVTNGKRLPAEFSAAVLLIFLWRQREQRWEPCAYSQILLLDRNYCYGTFTASHNLLDSFAKMETAERDTFTPRINLGFALGSKGICHLLHPYDLWRGSSCKRPWPPVRGPEVRLRGENLVWMLFNGSLRQRDCSSTHKTDGSSGGRIIETFHLKVYNMWAATSK